MVKPRFSLRNRYVFLFDLLIIVITGIGSFALLFELGERFLFYFPQALWMVGIGLFIKPFIYYHFGLYRRFWVYASVSELKIIAAAVTAASIFLSITIVILTTLQQTYALKYLGFPRSALVIDGLLSLVLVGSSRFAIRILAESRSSPGDGKAHPRRIAIVGAGDAGALVLREIQKNTHTNMEPVCFVDDDPMKQKQLIQNVVVAGTIKDLGKLIDQRKIEEVIIAIPSAPGMVVRQVAEICRPKLIPFKTMPGIYELIGGKVNVSRLRDIDISDLLRRSPAQIESDQVGMRLINKRVMVTGAGGSIGRELCRQIARWNPAGLILLGHGENSIFEILTELQQNFSRLPIYPVVCDVRDIDRMNTIFENQRPQVIFHAAAHKHVPLMEANVEEAVTNNIQGTRNVVEMALNHDVEQLIMVSTDKAIRPSSVMGATKRMAELIVLDAAHKSGKEFTIVRFGNVLGSRGSVVPHFKEQIARGGPVTITHPDMERYFMTIPEAVHLVLQAMTMGNGGEVFVLKMGEQVRIADLAEDLIRLSGFEPGKDIEIVYTGIRPGEKLSEELWDQWATYEQTQHPDIVQLLDEDILSGSPLQQVVDELIHLAREGDAAAIVKIMDEMIPGAAVRSTPPPDVTSLL